MREKGMNIGSFKTTGLASVVGTILAGLVHSPALAQHDKLSGFPAMVLGGETATATVSRFSVPCDNLIKLNNKDVSLAKTSLEEVQVVAGGTIHSHAVSSVKTAWICYEIKGDNRPRRIWFISDGLNKKKGEGAILNLISAELATDKAV